MTTSIVLVSMLLMCSIHRETIAQPIKLDLDIKEDGNTEPQTAIMVENNKERSITLSPGRSYDIGCTSSAGFNTNDNKWFTVNLDSTLTSITENTPASNNESAVYMFQPNPDDNNRWILRLQNFASSMTNTYVCISPTLNKSLTINEGNPSVIASDNTLVFIHGDANTRLFSIFISGNPKPDISTVVWMHNGNIITNGYLEIINIIASKGELTFDGEFDFKHAGVYTVNVTNQFGSATDFFTIVIQASPLLTLSSSQSQPIIIGDNVALTCIDSQGSPSPLFYWSIDATNIIDGIGGYNIETVNTNTSILTISNTMFNHSGRYRCKAVNEADQTSEYYTLEVLLPTPSINSLTVSPSSGPLYAGSQVILTCQGTLQDTSFYSGSLSANFTWKKNGVEVLESGDVTISTSHNGGLTYSSTLSLSQASIVQDNGSYICELKTVSGSFVSSVVTSPVTPLRIEAPPVTLHLTPLSVAVPNFHPYNALQFNCSANIPNELSLIVTFQWFKNTNQTLVHGTNGISIVSDVRRSILSLAASNPGVDKYTCKLDISLPGPEPILTLTHNATVTVRGPRAPLLPTGITVGNVNHNSALIQWTVLSIAYSPETYYIRYGLSSNKLNYVSSSINGATDIAAKSQTYSITLQHLIHNEVYYYSVVSYNNYTETTSAVDSFQTTKLSLIQVKAGPFRGCSNGRVLDSSLVKSFMKTEISKEISSRCNCNYPSSHLVNGTLLCTESNSNELIYRAYVVGTADISSSVVVNYITDWVKSKSGLISGVAKISVDNSCTVNISSAGDPICSITPTVTSEPTVAGTGLFDSNHSVLFVVVAGAIILLLLMILVVVVIVIVYQNHKIRAIQRRRSGSVTRRDSSVIDGGSPISPKWKGEAYVTTECPAYLTSYNHDPHINHDHIERQPTPGIYDSIDNLSGRGISPRVTNPLTVSGSSDTDDTTGGSATMS